MGSFPLLCLITGRVIGLTDWCSNSKKSKQRFSGSGCIPRSFEKWFQTEFEHVETHSRKKIKHKLLEYLECQLKEGPWHSTAGSPNMSNLRKVKQSQACAWPELCQGLGSKRFKTQFFPRFTHHPGHNDMPPLELFKHVCVLAFRYT